MERRGAEYAAQSQGQGVRRVRRRRGGVVAPDAAPRASFRGWSTDVARGELVRTIVAWMAIILIYRQTLAAPIRAFVPILWYVPDVLMALTLVTIAGAGMRNKVIPVLVSVGVGSHDFERT